MGDEEEQGTMVDDFREASFSEGAENRDPCSYDGDEAYGLNESHDATGSAGGTASSSSTSRGVNRPPPANLNKTRVKSPPPRRLVPAPAQNPQHDTAWNYGAKVDSFCFKFLYSERALVWCVERRSLFSGEKLS